MTEQEQTNYKKKPRLKIYHFRVTMEEAALIDASIPDRMPASQFLRQVVLGRLIAYEKKMKKMAEIEKDLAKTVDKPKTEC